MALGIGCPTYFRNCVFDTIRTLLRDGVLHGFPKIPKFKIKGHLASWTIFALYLLFLSNVYTEGYMTGDIHYALTRVYFRGYSIHYVNTASPNVKTIWEYSIH